MYLHIGGHKTGTTYLQSVLWRNRGALRRQGMLFPGQRKAAHAWANLDLRNAGFRGYRAPQAVGAWPRLVDEIRDWGGPAIIDQEMFSLLRPAHIGRALDDLSFAKVRIVFTARDMARQLPAAWQEWIKNQGTIAYGEFLAKVRDPSTPEAARFMSMHDVPTILSGWAQWLPASRIHLITVPPSGAPPDVLWRRFAEVVHLEPDRYNFRTRDTNTSLGAAEVALLRDLNAALGDALPWSQYTRLVKYGLVPKLAARRSERIGLPDDAYDWAVIWAKQAVQDLAGAGYRLTGDLDELIPLARPDGADPDDLDADTRAEVARAALELAAAPADASVAALALLLQQQSTEPLAAAVPRRLWRTVSHAAEPGELPSGGPVRRVAAGLTARARRQAQRLRR